MGMNVSRTRLVGISLAIFAVAIWLFWPSIHGGFLSRMDDAEYLQNSIRLKGITWNAVKWAFTILQPYYHPLPRLSHVLDYQIWRENAAGHHATSVALHALNAGLLFGFLWTFLGKTHLTSTERLSIASLVAVVFAIHPLQVESVAWMSGRTQLLCTTFGIGCLWAYAAGAHWCVVWGFYLMALLCKPMAVSFPFVMLAMDCFPLRRYQSFGWRQLVREKAAMFALAVFVGVVTVITELRQGNLTASSESASLSQRMLLACQSLTFYLGKLVWPSDLSPTYPLSVGASANRASVLLSALSVVLVTGIAAYNWKRWPALTAAWGAYLALILPVSGLMQTWGVAARYAYVAVIPLLLLLSGAMVCWWRRIGTAARFIVAGLAICELGAFVLSTRHLIPDWRNDEALERAILARFPDSAFDNRALAQTLLDQGRAREALAYAQRSVQLAPQTWEAHMILGLVLGQLGRFQDAIVQDDLAFRLNPHPALAHYDFGLALMDIGRAAEATEHFQQALQIKPNYPGAHNNLGSALYKMGRRPEAMQQWEAELRVHPDDADAHNNLGGMLAQTGNLKEAIEHFEQALRARPNYADAHYNLGRALAQTGNTPGATSQYQQALRLKPDYAEAHYSLGFLLAGEGHVNDAIEQYQRALQAKPEFALAHYELGRAFDYVGRAQEAIACYEQVVRLLPDLAEAHNILGVDLAKTAQIAEAITQLEQALRINPNYTDAHYNLANALVQSGRIQDAIEHYQMALKLRPDFGPASNALAHLQAAR